MDSRRVLKDIFYAALKAVDPYEAVRARKDILADKFEKGGFRRIYLLGFGKAACPMARAVEEILPVDRGIVITKYGHCYEEFKPEASEVYEAGHPIPDQKGMDATNKLLDMVQNLDSETLIVCLVSGGGSALLTSPLEGITLQEKREATDLLLRAGADIFELNTVRKHISCVKGGRLAQILYPAKVIALILSDVIGDKLDVIASGPTAPDSSSFSDALRVLRKHNLTDELPESIIETLEKGSGGMISECMREGDICSRNVENIIVGCNRIALEAGKSKAGSLGYHREILSSELTGEASEIGGWLVSRAKEIRKAVPGEKVCIISGGETTVTVRGSGKGGRNTELALSAAMALDGMKGFTFLSAGTDGTDGPTDAAGAIVDGDSIQTARELGMDAREYLQNNDTYTFFRETGDIFVTGPTGTNVMDIQIMLIE
jgi:glycerate-2-kinase